MILHGGESGYRGDNKIRFRQTPLAPEGLALDWIRVKCFGIDSVGNDFRLRRQETFIAGEGFPGIGIANDQFRPLAKWFGK